MIPKEFPINPQERALVLEFGDENEVARLQENLLPKSDVNTILREVVYGPVYDWPLADPLRPVDMVRLANLRHHSKDPFPINARVEFDKRPVQSLGADAFERLREVKRLYPGDFVEASEIIATVGKLVHRRYKVRVVVRIGDRPLLREMWLDDDRDHRYEVHPEVAWREVVA